MRYVTIKELSDIIRRNLWKIPHDIDCVVGIPRSGMLPASMIALYLNTNLCDVDTLLDNKTYLIGDTRSYMMKHHEIKKVLVVDDSVNSGKTISKAKEKLSPLTSKYELIYLTPITTSTGVSFTDISFEIIDGIRIFEWNLYHHWMTEFSCFDIDGVLCCDPIIDDDGEQYILFLENAKPLFIPSGPLGIIISCRLEKYRKPTEAWLAKNHIEYKQLVMLDFPNKAARIKWGKHGEYKGEYYKKSDCSLFVESSYQQAKIIAEISHKPVICTETNSLIYVKPQNLNIKEILYPWVPDFVVNIYRMVRRRYFKKAIM